MYGGEAAGWDGDGFYQDDFVRSYDSSLRGRNDGSVASQKMLKSKQDQLVLESIKEENEEQ